MTSAIHSERAGLVLALCTGAERVRQYRLADRPSPVKPLSSSLPPARTGQPTG